jgi:Family of unknown function (DUF6812)
MGLKTYKRIKPAKVVVIMANGQVIEGTINIGFEERVTDFLEMPEMMFIPVFDINNTRDVIIINKTQIASVQPVAEAQETVASEEHAGVIERASIRPDRRFEEEPAFSGAGHSAPLL